MSARVAAVARTAVALAVLLAAAMLAAAALVTLLVAAPAHAQSEQIVDFAGNTVMIDATDEGAVVRIFNGLTASQIMREIPLEVNGIRVVVHYTSPPNGTSEPEDIIEILDVSDGWLAFPAYLLLDEGAWGEIRIIRNLLG